MSQEPRPRFSQRTDWEQHPNRLSEAWHRRLASGLDSIDLTESNPTRCGFSYPEGHLLTSLADSRALRYEPTPKGLLHARAALAAHLATAPGSPPCDPERLLLCASTSEAYGWLFKLLCDRGDRILVPRPSYPLLEFLAGLEDVVLDSYPLGFEGRWRVDLDALAAAITPRTRGVVVVHPNNPTGNALTAREAAAVTDFCAAHELALISDEVFLDYLETEAGAPSSLEPASSSLETPSIPLAGSIAAESPCLSFSLGGLSKSAGLPQIKVGWIRAGGPTALVEDAVSRLEVIADTYLSVNTPAQWALPAILKAGREVRLQIRHRTSSNRRWLQARSQGVPWELLPADGAWSAVLRVPRLHTEEEWCLLLAEEEGVLLHPGYFFDFESEAYLVASLLPEEKRFVDAMGRVLRRLES